MKRQTPVSNRNKVNLPREGATPHIIFETRSARSLVEALLGPETGAEWDALEDLVESPTRDEATPSRLDIFRTFLPDSLQPEAHVWFSTIENLREAGAFTAETWQYAMSVLDPTPKNQLLARLGELYLGTPVVQDTVSQVLHLTDRPQQFRRFNAIMVIRDPDTSPVVEEFARSLGSTRMGAAAVSSVELVDFAEGVRRILGAKLPLEAKQREIKRRRGSFASTAERVAKYLSRQSRLCPERQFRILFSGRESEATYFSLQLRHKGLHFRNAIEPGYKNKRGDKEPRIVLLPIVALPGLPSTETIVVKTENRRKLQPLQLTDAERFLLRKDGFPIECDRSLRRRENEDIARVLDMGGRVQIFECQTHDETRISRSKDVEVSESQDQWNVRPEGKSEIFSASALARYRECPARYWISRHGVRIPESEESLLALELGKLTHQALEKVFRRRSECPDLDLPAFAREAFETELSNRQPPLGPLWVSVLKKSFEVFSESLPSMEQALSELFPRSRVWDLESEFLFKREGIAFSGRWDRLQELQDQSLVVMDFKTGVVRESPQSIESGENLQALIYLLALQALYPEKAAGFLYYDLLQAEVKRGLVDKSHCAEPKNLTRGHAVDRQKWEETLQAGWNALRKLTEEFKTLPFRPRPSADHCLHCPYPTICRSAHGMETV